MVSLNRRPQAAITSVVFACVVFQQGAGLINHRPEVANTMCDLRARLNDMEHRCRFDSDVLVERLTRQTLYRANRLFMEAYTEILELDSCFKD
ncbi:hypothetical protein QUF37_23830 (plasmid) [Escherichia coli]|nr:hypothetical protein [Escherichia coli]WKU30533.1 hypothetical protein QUF37_23830 [Escherichia coli]